MTSRIVGCLIAAALSLGSVARAAETGPVAEVWGCTFKEGSDMTDIDSATEYYKSVIARLNDPALNAMEAYIWTPFRAQTDVDSVWFSIHANLNAFGAVSDLLSGEDGQAVQARYFEHADCGASLMELTPIYSAETVEFTRPTIIEAFRCSLNPGKTMADVQPVVEEWRAWIEGQGGWDNYMAFMMTPIAAATPFDLYYFGVHENASAYAARTTETITSDTGSAINAKFGEVHRCEATTWIGRNVIEASGG
jgi:hypothetical protein